MVAVASTLSIHLKYAFLPPSRKRFSLRTKQNRPPTAYTSPKRAYLIQLRSLRISFGLRASLWKRVPALTVAVCKRTYIHISIDIHRPSSESIHFCEDFVDDPIKTEVRGGVYLPATLPRTRARPRIRLQDPRLKGAEVHAMVQKDRWPLPR
jgi:hypothetical protein